MENQTYHESTDIGNVKGRSHIQIQLFLIGHWCWKFEDLQVFQVFTSEAICDCESKDPPRRFSRDDCDGWRICLACLRHTSHQHYPECGPGVFIHGYEGMIYTNEHTTNNESMSNGFFWSRIFSCFSCVSLSLLNMVLLWEFESRYLSSAFLKCNKQSLLLPMISLFRLRRCCSGTASYNAVPLGKN